MIGVYLHPCNNFYKGIQQSRVNATPKEEECTKIQKKEKTQRRSRKLCKKEKLNVQELQISSES